MPLVILAHDAGGDDSPNVELTQYPRGEGRGLGLQMLLGSGVGCTYLTPESAKLLGATLLSWGQDVSRAAGARAA